MSKPDYLGPEFSTRFQDRGVVDAYHLRPPYPDEVFTILTSLITDQPRTVLDVGSGPGDIARRLAPLVERVDAVDFSLPMLERGRRLPGGDRPNLHWIYGQAEDAPLNPPYALITAGQSLHWMEWEIVLPRFHDVLTPHGFLAIVDEHALPVPWQEELGKLVKRFSTNQGYRPLNLLQELEQFGLYRHQGEKETAPVPFIQSIEDYIAGQHSMSSLSREHMGGENASAFDSELHEIVSRYANEGMLEFQIVGTVAWGTPLCL